jgi:hypothetical protein
MVEVKPPCRLPKQRDPHAQDRFGSPPVQAEKTLLLTCLGLGMLDYILDAVECHVAGRHRDALRR